MEKEDVKLTKLWIERFVIGLRLCPFAHFSFYEDTIYYDVSNNKTKVDCLDDLRAMSIKMKAAQQSEISNSFLIFDGSLTFDFLLSLKQSFDTYLEKEELDELFQTVVFHPEFQFGDEHFHAAGNFTNRSPYPMIHILRVEEVTRAIEMTEDIDDIPLRNKQVLEDLNIKKISEVFDDDFMDKKEKYV